VPDGLTTPAITDPRGVSEWTDRIYPEKRGIGGVILRWRPYICPFHRLLALIPQVERMLDVGCGNGLLGNLAVATRRVTRCRGFDTAEGPIRTARSAILPAGVERPTFQTLTIDEWPEGDFDVVTCVDVIHHVPSAVHSQFVQTVCRSVAPEGKLIIKDMAPRPFWCALANRLHDLVMARQWIHYCEPADVARWVKDSGMTIIETGQCRMLWYAHYFVVAIRASGKLEKPENS